MPVHRAVSLCSSRSRPEEEEVVVLLCSSPLLSLCHRARLSSVRGLNGSVLRVERIPLDFYE